MLKRLAQIFRYFTFFKLKAKFSCGGKGTKTVLNETP